MITPILFTGGPIKKKKVKRKLEYDRETRLLIRGNLGSLNLDDRLKTQSEGTDLRFGAPTKSHIQRCRLNDSKAGS